MKLKNATVKQVLDAIIDQLHGYQWKADGQIVHIYPSNDLRKTSVLKHLDEMVPVFQSSGLDVTDTINYSFQDVWMRGIPISWDSRLSTSKSWKNAADATPSDAAITINVSTPTRLRDVLDLIISTDLPAYWLAVPVPSNGKLNISGETLHLHKGESPINQRWRTMRDKEGRPLEAAKEGDQWKLVPTDSK